MDTITEHYGPTSAFAKTSSSNMDAAQNQYGLADDWRFYIGDPGSFATIDPPAAPFQIVDGRLTLRGTMNGAWGDWSGYADVYWDITLDVCRDEGSPYGCIVTGYQVTAEDQTIPIPTTAAPTVRTNTPPPAQPAPGFDSNGLVFADSSTRYLTDADLRGLSKEMLGFARNEIFARNGNLFRKDKYINHYTQYDWYNNIPNKRHDIYEWELNPIEQANIALILKYENS